MSRKSIKRILRDSIVTHLSAQGVDELGSVQVVASFAGAVLADRHIRVTTASATPQASGAVNLGRWDVSCMITVVSQIDDTDNDTHDNLVGLVEAYALQGNATLAAALTTAEIKVDNVYVGDSEEVSVEGMLYSGTEIKCECYLI